MSLPLGEVAGRNRLLRALPAAERDAVLAEADLVEMEVGDVVNGSDEPVTHAYFPGSGVLSVVHAVDGSEVEVATVGNEGMVGLSPFLGAGSYPGSCYSQVSGAGVRLPAAALLRLAGPGTAFHDHLQRYVQAFLVQTAQNAACNLVHQVEQRCARWVLSTHDRLEGDEFGLTQELLAQMLGVRRPSVTAAAGALQRAGLIRYRRGSVTVTDREGLRQVACPCYAVIRREIERALPDAG